MQRIVNPLFSQTQERVITEAREFHESYGLSRVVGFDVFERAVLVARDPGSYTTVQSLTDVERYALKEEYDGEIGSLGQLKLFTKDFIILLATCCMAAIVQ